ncbi:hypothetical protein HPB47_011370 [Ixodes persulcatus]|uniref:Uncharacterized protein n=1 Tax=Ixodes persulcatus TaxID=34615 RepID=A0AC60NWM5_IXOPE|nr:hypothetical protein HPB47_011370 [Ixodes persulcatus]
MKLGVATSFGSNVAPTDIPEYGINRLVTPSHDGMRDSADVLGDILILTFYGRRVDVREAPVPPGSLSVSGTWSTSHFRCRLRRLTQGRKPPQR